jgi:hypothetical protein
VTNRTCQGIGEFTDIQTAPTSTEITFKDRKTAEKFFNSVLLNNKEVPGLEGSPVELAWGGANGSAGSVPTTPGSTSTPTATTTTANRTTAASANGTNEPVGSGAATAGSTSAAEPDGGAKREKPAATTTTTDTATIAGDGVGGDEEHAGASSSDKDVHILLDRPPQDLDFEVADENGWDY